MLIVLTRISANTRVICNVVEDLLFVTKGLLSFVYAAYYDTSSLAYFLDGLFREATIVSQYVLEIDFSYCL